MTNQLSIGLIGLGKTGSEILSLLPDYNMTCGAICTKGSHKKEKTITSLDKMPWGAIDVFIDFSHADGLIDRVHTICAHQKPLVLGTTGWDKHRQTVLDCFQKSNTPLVWGANFSLGVWIFQSIVSSACSILSDYPQYDIALLEAHHKEKKDAPSGTALSLCQEIQHQLPGKKGFHSTECSPAPENGIDIATLRVGSVPGTHQVWIEGEEESITLTHSARNRRTFARGALTAASLLHRYRSVWHIHDLLKQHLSLKE